MASTTAGLGPPAKCSEGSTRLSRSRGTEAILAFQGSASPIVPIPGSWDIDDGAGRNVRVGTDALDAVTPPILGGLLSSPGERGSRIDAKVDFLVQRAVFVTDHEPCFSVILGDQRAQAPGAFADIEDEIRGVGLARPQSRGERHGQIPRRSNAAWPSAEGS